LSPAVPAVTGKQMAKAATGAGFRLDRQRGSHAVFVRDSDKRRVVIPMHAGKTIKPKTLMGIVRDMGLTLEEFAALL
jgi:predicted RNA binding protein YcfA (HicA-like mRNA interferase family)